MSLLEWLKSLFAPILSGFGARERPSPQDIVPEGSISVEWGIITINMNKLNIHFNEPPIVWIPGIPDTNSMDGVMDFGHHVILLKGQSTDQEILVYSLKVGDIAVYHSNNRSIIHRIIEIGNDKYGRYFRFKGDNNAIADPEKVRDNQIDWLCLGVIY